MSETFEARVQAIVDAIGFDGLAQRVPLTALPGAPTRADLLALLQQTPLARAQIERLHLLRQREARDRARRKVADDLRGAAAVVVRATQSTTDVVEGMHGAIGAFPVVTDLVYAVVRGVTGVVGKGVDAAVAGLAPLLGDAAPGAVQEGARAALNGLVGDHLEATGNPLAVQMALRPALDDAHDRRTLLVLVHGSSMNHLQWLRDGHDHGWALARDLGLTPAWLHYNSGRHTSSNGRDFAALLDVESAAFHDVVIVAHSMGGLVARAAVALADNAAWRQKLRALITLGTPHHGSSLERGGNIIETLLGKTPWSAPLQGLARVRSAGVTDLRYGNVVDADWQARDRFAHGGDPRTPTPLPTGVRCCAIAAAADELVAVDSALGVHAQPALSLRFDDRLTVPTNHLGLLSSPAVYDQLLRWLTP